MCKKCIPYLGKQCETQHAFNRDTLLTSLVTIVVIGQLERDNIHSCKINVYESSHIHISE